MKHGTEVSVSKQVCYQVNKREDDGNIQDTIKFWVSCTDKRGALDVKINEKFVKRVDVRYLLSSEAGVSPHNQHDGQMELHVPVIKVSEEEGNQLRIQFKQQRDSLDNNQNAKRRRNGHPNVDGIGTPGDGARMLRNENQTQ
jgi:hypothetical protein